MQNIVRHKFFLFILLLIPLIFVAPVNASIKETIPFGLNPAILPNTPLLQTYGIITGTVTGGGQPLTDVSVSVYYYNVSLTSWDYIAWSETNSSGQYIITNLEPGSYRLNFYDRSNGYLREYYNDASTLEAATDISLTVGETVNIDITLTLGGKITGTVTDGNGPVNSIGIKAYQHNNVTDDWQDVGWVTTNDDGIYTIQGLETGTYRVEFEDWAREYLPEYYNDAETLEAATDIMLMAGETVNIDAILTPGGKITGRVTDSSGPITPVSVKTYRYNSATDDWEKLDWTASPDENGNYTVPGLQTGIYRVKFDSWNHLPTYYQDATSLSSATDIAIITGSTVSDIDGFLYTPACIYGTVTKATGSVGKNVKVEAYLADNNISPIAQTYPNVNGNYSISNLYPGTYRVHFTDLSGKDLSFYYDEAPTFDMATGIEVVDGNCANNINAFLPEASRITDIQRPRFIQPGQNVTVKLNFTIPNGLSTPPKLGIKIPSGWSFLGNAAYAGDNDGTFLYNSGLALELQNEFGGNWWAGYGTTDEWNETETTVQITLRSSTTPGDYLPTFVTGTSQGWGRLEEAPVRITEQIPVRGVDVTAVRDYESSSIGVSTSLQQAQDMDMQVIYHYLGWDATEVNYEYYHWVILDDILKQARAYNQKVALRIYNPPAHYDERVLFNQGLSGANLQAQDMVEHKIKNFMQLLTQHVKEVGLNDIVAGYVIWNEPNIAGEWGAPPNPAAYMTMLTSAYEGAKEGDPAAVIISAPLAPTGDTPEVAINDLTYLGQLYDLGLADYVDYIGMNGLGFQYDPDHDSGSVDYNFMRLKHLHDVMVSKGDYAHKAWVLEVGWLRESGYDMGDFEPYKVTKEQQAQYLCRAYEKAHDEWWNWVDLMTIWNLDFKDYPHNYPPESAFHWYSISDNELAEECLTNLVLGEIPLENSYLPVILR